MNIKKWILPVLLVVLLGGYIAYKQFFNTQENPAPIINNNQISTDNETINPNSKGTNPPINPPATQTGYKDGQYTGDVANTVYGDMQVKAIISDGKITDVQFLAYPNHMGHTMEVSSMSLPILKSEAIQSQSANVDVVSGATQTSEGFSQSLASALSKAS